MISDYHDRAKAAADRIRDKINIVDVLAAYGYRVRSDGGGREQQFSCDLHGDGRDNTPSARVYPDSNSWYCVATTERVLTEKGWLRLGDMAQQSPRTYDGSSWEAPLYMPRGVRDAVKVSTRAGYEVMVTPDHEIEVDGRGWVEAQHLHPGDVLVVPKPMEPRFNKNWALGVDDLNERSYGRYPKLSLPSQWSVELGEALGYVFGDGWVVPRENPASGMVGLTSHSSDVGDARAVFRHMQTWASGRGSVVRGKEYVQDQYVFTISNDGFCEFFRRMGLDKDLPANQRSVPQSIWRAPECGVRGFLRGVYGAEGSVFRPSGRKGIKVNLYSVSGPFLRDAQLLLLQFGIHSRLYPPSKTRVESGKRKGKLSHPAGYLQLATGKDILTFRERIGIASARKQMVLDSYEYNPRGSRPFKAVVRGVEPAGVVEVADLSMPVEHSFIAGGIKVHNCFACDKTRDAIGTVRAKEDISFWAAVKLLEHSVGLEPLPIDYEYERQDLRKEIAEALDPTKTFEDDEKRVCSFLDSITHDRSLPLDTILKFWEAFDQAVFNVRGPKGEGGPWSEAKGRVVLVGLIKRITDAEIEHAKVTP